MMPGVPLWVAAAIVAVNMVFLSFWVSLTFIAVKGLRAAEPQRKGLSPGLAAAGVGAGLVAWLTTQGLVAASGWYRGYETWPPLYLFAAGPPLTFAFGWIAVPSLRKAFGHFPLTFLTYIHTIRFFVELVVLALFIYGAIPVQLSLRGANPDIWVGVTAPLIGYMCFTRGLWSKKVALTWHVLAALTLLWVIGIFFATMRSPLQFLEVEQPSEAFFYFPFVWIASHGVPTVLTAHLIAIWRLRREASAAAA